MKKWFFGFLGFAVLMLPVSSQAEEDKNDQEPVLVMEEMVVTATRYEQKVEKVPAHVAIITADQIKESGAQSVPDALRSLGGVIVSDLNGNGNNQTIDMGGFGETANRHVAVVINGRRVNPIDQSGIRWSTIPVENVERIEVLHGSGSVLYGDNANGGVINIITKDAKEGLQINAEVGVGNLDTRKGLVNLNYGNGQTGLILGFTQYETDGYRDRSEADRQNIHGKLSADPTGSLSLFLEADITEANYQFPGSLTEAQKKQDRKQAVDLNDKGKAEDTSIAFGLEYDWGKNGLFAVNLSRQEEDREGIMDSWGSVYIYDMQTTGLSPQYILEKNIGGHDNRLTLGMDFYKTDYDLRKGSSKSNLTSYFDHEKTTISGYMQDEFNLLDSLLLNVGARYEDPETELTSDISGSKTEKEIDDSEWAWNLGLAYAFKPGSKVYGRVYRSFRYPVVDEYTDLSTGAINENLKPETSVGYEAGLRLSMFSNLVLNLRAYSMDLDDEIVYTGSWPTGQNENLDETRHAGGEFDFRYQALDFLALFGGAGYTNAEFTKGENDGKKIPLVPEWKGNAGFELDFDFGLKYRLQCNYVGERYFGGDYSNSLKQMDKYTTVDMYAAYTYKTVEFFLNATNIFDEEYSAAGYYGSYYPMPEAVYYGGVRLNF
ncbi:MAG: TonB-dependent receptor [Deltaproteobacteria bacterium]|nr:TonB-dependent receptor [Deltaproteobacteria bacterium]